MTVLEFFVILSTTVFCITNTSINFGILYLTFVSKRLSKSPTLTLFYFRFAIDGMVGLITLLGRLMEFTGSFSLIQITFPYQIYVFITIWSVINLTTLRVFLVIFITVDRVFAVFLPITYHNTRRKIPNVFVMILAVWGPIMDNVYQWIICDHKFIFVPDCSSFGCLATMCFQQYTISYEITTASIVVGLSLILALKFFIWNNCKNKSKSNCLERANRLALLDAAMIFCFDLVPISVVALCPNVFFDVELALSLRKSSGYAVEGFLTYLTLKRRNTIIPQSNNLFLKTTSKQSS